MVDCRYCDFINKLIKDINGIKDDEQRYIKIQEEVYKFTLETNITNNKKIAFMLMLVRCGLSDLNTTIKLCEKSDMMKKFIDKYIKLYILCNLTNVKKYDKLSKRLIKLVSRNKIKYLYNIYKYHQYKLFI